MANIADYLIAEQLSRAERVGDYLTSQQLSRSENIGEFLTEQYFNSAPKLGNYMTLEAMKGAIYKTDLNGMGGMGCGPCRGGNMGNVTCGGECGERLMDDPDRMVTRATPGVGGPETPIVNTFPGNDAGPENNDWAIDGMGLLYTPEEAPAASKPFGPIKMIALGAGALFLVNMFGKRLF